MYLTSWSTSGDIRTPQLFESLIRPHLVLMFMCCSQLCIDWVVLRSCIHVFRCGHGFLGFYTYTPLLLLVIKSLEGCGLAYKSISRAHLRKPKRLKKNTQLDLGKFHFRRSWAHKSNNQGKNTWLKYKEQKEWNHVIYMWSTWWRAQLWLKWNLP